MFTQREIAEAFAITPQSVTQALRGCPSERKEVIRVEGRRNVRRVLRVFHPNDVFRLAARTGKLEQYKSLCEGAGLPAETFHVTRKEIAFGDMLRRFLPPEIEICFQYPIDKFRIDFYLPEYKLCIEYDEQAHSYNASHKKDTLRQTTIESKYNLSFVRVKEDSEEIGLFNIARKILT